ncbi:MAG TPA: urease accessory UreF family protein [Verrucomicrobiae bacterium]
MIPTEKANDWLLWQLADSAFPAGGFAHSGGLEAAWQHGEIRGADDLASFLETFMCQVATSMIPFVNAAHGDPDQLEALNLRCDAFLTNHVANRASRLQGRAFMNSASRIFGATINNFKVSDPCHFAPAFGAVSRNLSVEESTTTQLFAFQSLRGVVAAAVRLGIVGPMEAQAIQHRMSTRVAEIFEFVGEVKIDDIASTSPLLEIWQATQDRLYSRLFQS